MTEIQFARGLTEDAIPEVRLTRSRTGDSGTATFYFEKPKALSNEQNGEVTGMYMIDEEGELVTKDVNAKFINGRPEAIEATYIMKSKDEWERFMRFMERYAEDHDLGFSKS
ncbi:photosystem II reaction center protein Psb28 [Merismopedia glauca]|uniref:Photosystem II reaction center Psb28 protein n=1 Tax=Merismopedia glauca CCAP 1448/3 TaxID=1296344 RepID=A0A2T1C1Y0_9CYAN|nr:photosystem II reaction center protein Psb28 [Merismopedia glauca CCAP 1448/3]